MKHIVLAPNKTIKKALYEFESWGQNAKLDFSSISAPFVKSISQLPAVDQARLASLSIMNQFGIQQAVEVLGVPERTLRDWITHYLPDFFSSEESDNQAALYRWNKKWLAAFSHLLNQNYSGMLEQLYRRAEPWLSQTNCSSNGVQYLIVESHNKWAQRTLGSLCRTWLTQNDASAIVSLVESLSDEVYQSSPNLLLTYIWALLVQRRTDRAHELLQIAEQTKLDSHFDPSRPFLNVENSIQVLNALVQFHNQPKASSTIRIKLLENALELDSEFHGAVLTTYASLLHSVGIVDMSKQAITKAIRHHEQSHNVVQLSQVQALYWQCDFNQGNCDSALWEAERYLYDLQQQLAAVTSSESYPLKLAIAITYANIGHFYFELNQVLKAQQAFQKALPDLSGTDLKYIVIASNIGLIRIHNCRGEVSTSEQLLTDTVRQTCWRNGSWLNAVICFEKMRVQRFLGKSTKPIAEEYGLLTKALDVDTLFMGEYEKAHLFWIKCKLMLLLEDERYADANMLALKGLIKSMSVQDMRFQIVFSNIKALCDWKLGDMVEANISMNRALKLVQNHGFRRAFLDDEFGWTALWDEMDQTNSFSTDLEPSLLSEIRNALVRRAVLQDDSSLTEQEENRELRLLRCKSVGLTEKEYEIIKLLAEGLCNKKIASRSDIALTTVKWHLQNIFGKLQVRNRTEAVVKAQELGVLF